MEIVSWFRAVPICLLAMLLAGCVGGTVDPAHQAGAKRIGVISVLGDEALGQGADPRLDAIVCAHAVDRLGAAHPGSAVVNLQADRGSVHIRIPRRAGLFDGGQVADEFKDTADAAHQLAALRRLDLVVMITPSVGVNSGAGQPPNYPGYGVWRASLFGAHVGGETAFANFSVQAFDGRTGQRLSFKFASVHKMVDEPYQLTEALHEVVLEGVDEQLAHMHLTRDE